MAYVGASIGEYTELQGSIKGNASAASIPAKNMPVMTLQVPVEQIRAQITDYSNRKHF